jgi:hypothetical protein
LRVPNNRLQLGHFTGIRLLLSDIEPLLGRPSATA